MFSRHYRKVKILFGLTDIALTAAAFIAAYQTRIRVHFERVFFLSYPEALLLLGLGSLCWVAAGYWLDVYEKLDSAHTRVILRDTFRQCALGSICLVLAQYLTRLDLSRSFVLLFVVYSWMLLCLFRINAGHWIGTVRREFGKAHFIMVVGTGERALHLGRALEQSADYGVRLMGFLDEQPGTVRLSQSYGVQALARLPELLRQHVIDEVIFAVDSRQLAGMEDIFLLCDEEGVRTRVIVDFFPHVNSEVYLDRLGHIPLLTFSAAPHDEIRLLLKRATDVVLAAAGLVLLLPFMLLTALAIRFTSPGPAIFRQERCGLNGRRFVFYKFRSMCENAEELKPELMHLNRKQTAFKIPNDPRLTRVGRVLRKFSVDEWPQLWNVLKGDMSLVGPRPAVPGEVENYLGWQRRRLRMRPGLTCLWAISGRDALDFDTWMKMDMQYIDNWSLALDWKIMLRTIPRVLSGKGPTEMHLVPTQQEVVSLLRETGAIRDGHFEYPNGLHATEYMQVQLAMRYYQHAKTLSVGLSRLLRANAEIRAMVPELSIVSPDTGGLPVAYGVCEALRAHQVYWADRKEEDGMMRFRQYLEQAPGEKVLLVDDILRSGRNLSKLKALVESRGAEVVGLAVIIYQPNPTTVDFGRLPFYYLAKLDAMYYKDAASCEMCRAGVPVEKVWV